MRARKEQPAGTSGSRASDRRTLPPGLDRYEVVSQLGQGGMGAVFRARDRATGELIALKTLELQTPRAIALFEREYRTLATLAHPCVARTFDYGISQDGRRFYTMELIEGDDLNTLAPMPWRELCSHLREVAEVLSLLHGRGLLHRDVSPRNVRVGRDGRVRLLDFGALAPLRETGEVVGTPTCIAPEAIRSGVLDERSDLFSFGATAYIALSGRRPYDVTTLAAAEAGYRKPPESLRARFPELPVELDDLVLMLVQIDPDRRPASAADVIERLNAIAGISEARDSEIPTGHFASSSLIGRMRELLELRGHLEAAMLGRGTALAIDGAPRMGRTRLAHELLIESRLIGATAVFIEGGGERSGGACQQLLNALATAAPHAARARFAAEPLVAAMLGADRTVAEAEAASSPREASSALPSAVVRAIEALAGDVSLAIIVDDVHLLDSVSAGVIFGLAHGSVNRRMLLALTASSVAPLHPTIERTLQSCARIKLRPLGSSAVDTLVTSIFGQVPHRARLSRWLETVSGGNPAYCLDLMEALVRRRIIKRMSGTWWLPEELPQSLLPASVQDALLAILAELDEGSLELARLIALQRGGVPLSLCRELMRPRTHVEVRALCETLLAARVVSGGPAGYRIAHDGYRAALLSPLAAPELARLHRSAGEALLVHLGCTGSALDIEAASLSVEVVHGCLQAGWHLLHGGAAERGRDLLRTMGLQLTRYGQSVADAVPALESALVAYEAERRPIYERLSLMAPLTLAGTFLDPRLTYRYGEPLLKTVAEALGVELALRLGRFLPKRLALYGALAFAAVRMPLTSRRLIARDFIDAMQGFVGIATAVLATYATLSDEASAARLLERLRPFGWFPPRHPAAITYRFQLALGDLAAGRSAECVRALREVLVWMKTPESVRALTKEPRRLYLVGLHIAIGSVDVFRTDGRVAESIRELELAGTPAALESAAGLRANHHACRGEMREYQAAREELDVLAAQGGSPWRQAVTLPRCRWWVEAQCEDALGLKRSIRKLEASSQWSKALSSTHAAAHACYLADRGLFSDALERYGAQLDAAARESNMAAVRLVGAYARVLRQSGQAERARELCTRTLARLTPDELELTCVVHGVELELGRAHAALGDFEAAAAHLDALCAAQRGHDNPLLHALSHVGRAEVALLRSDAAAFDDHVAQAERWTSRTQYAALYGVIHRLRGRARSTGIQSSAASMAPPWSADIVSVRDSIASCRGEAARQQLALDLLIEHARAAAGFLFLADRDVLRLAAPLHGLEPSDALQAELERRVRDWHDVDDSAATGIATSAVMETVVEAGVEQDPIARFEAKVGSAYRIVFLSLHQADGPHLVGVAALVEGKRPIRAIPGPLLDAIATGLYQTGDATVMR